MEKDWDDAFANMAHIPGSESFPDDWARAAASFREAHPPAAIAYGVGPRQRMDLFAPPGPPRGLFFFIHGGYWMMTGRRDWSHLARGAVAAGYAACLPEYTLAPEARISQITDEVAKALMQAAARVSGPIHIAGHSAGAHLALSMICEDSSLPGTMLARIASVVGISGVYDLRPLRLTTMNDTLRLTEEEAAAESPALLRAKIDAPQSLWVGAQERPEFLRQTRLMADAWPQACVVEEPGRHHFSVLDGLNDASSPLMARIFAP